MSVFKKNIISCLSGLFILLAGLNVHAFNCSFKVVGLLNIKVLYYCNTSVAELSDIKNIGSKIADYAETVYLPKKHFKSFYLYYTYVGSEYVTDARKIAFKLVNSKGRSIFCDFNKIISGNCTGTDGLKYVNVATHGVSRNHQSALSMSVQQAGKYF